MIDGTYSYWHAAGGGVFIGLASLIGVLASGKVPGISGVCSRLLVGSTPDKAWRVLFLVGMVVGAWIGMATVESAQEFVAQRSTVWMAVAGLLVGFGTRVGGGCTSGHGVCGMGMGARDSMVATILFMGTAVATVWGFNLFGL